MEIFVAPFYASSCHSNLFKTCIALVTLSGIIRRIKVEFLCFSDSLLSKHSIYEKYKNNKMHNKRITHLFYRHLTYILGKHHPYNKGPETVKVRQATCTVFEKKKKKCSSHFLKIWGKIILQHHEESWNLISPEFIISHLSRR